MHFTLGDYFFVTKEILDAGEGFFKGRILEGVHGANMAVVAFVNLVFKGFSIFRRLIVEIVEFILDDVANVVREV